MPALLHTLLLLLTLAGVYGWLHIPGLYPFSPQAFAGTILIYFIVKRLSKAKYWHILPAAMSIETILATFAFLLLIGSTGNTSSIFYPLTYIHLFFIVFSSHASTSVIMTMAIMLFHYSLTPGGAVGPHVTVSLLTMPIILMLFLFARLQYEEVIRDRLIIKRGKKQLEQLTAEDHHLKQFLQGFIRPKLDQLLGLSQFPQENQAVIQGQVQLLQVQVDETLAKAQKRASSPGLANQAEAAHQEANSLETDNQNTDETA
jgi:hypothetical protein